MLNEENAELRAAAKAAKTALERSEEAHQLADVRAHVNAALTQLRAATGAGCGVPSRASSCASSFPAPDLDGARRSV